MTPLLTRIDQDLVQRRCPDLRAELQAERAAYLARVGSFSDARSALADVRQTHADGRNPRVSVAMMVAEGVLHCFEDFNPRARDRLQRAHLLSESCGLADLSALSAAWLAQVEFLCGDIPALQRWLACWQPAPAKAGTAADLRFGLVHANALMACGETRRARSWFERTRQGAIDLGDEATIAASLHDKASAGLDRHRTDPADAAAEVGSLDLVAMEVASAYNFRVGAGHQALLPAAQACRARVLLLQGRHAAARALFEALLDIPALRLNFVPDTLLLRLEHAACLQALGETSRATEVYAAIDVRRHAQLLPKDRMLFLALYGRVSEALGFAPLSPELAAALQQARTAWQAALAELRTALQAHPAAGL